MVGPSPTMTMRASSGNGENARRLSGRFALNAGDFRLPDRLDLAVGVVDLRGAAGGHLEKVAGQVQRSDAIGVDRGDGAVIGRMHLGVAGGQGNAEQVVRVILIDAAPHL